MLVVEKDYSAPTACWSHPYRMLQEKLDRFKASKWGDLGFYSDAAHIAASKYNYQTIHWLEIQYGFQVQQI